MFETTWVFNGTQIAFKCPTLPFISIRSTQFLSSAAQQLSMVDMEDDVFYADLSKRISLLIAEEEVEVEMEERYEEQQQHRENYDHLVQGYGKSNGFSRVFSVMIPPTIQTTNQRTVVQPGLGPFFYERETRGTGVFIPKSSIPIRKNRSGAGRSKNNNKDSAHMWNMDMNMNMIPSNNSSRNSSNTHMISSSTHNYQRS